MAECMGKCFQDTGFGPGVKVATGSSSSATDAVRGIVCLCSVFVRLEEFLGCFA